VSTQILLYTHYGARLSADSSVYLQDAHTILEGHVQDGRSIWYAGYAFFLGVIFFFGGTINTVVLIQILLSGWGTYCLYHCSKTLFNNRLCGLFVATLYSVWIPIQEWNTYIYTESLFTTCCIFSFTALLKSQKPWHFWLTSLLFVFTFFIRPTGIALLVATFGYAFSFLWSKNHKQLAVLLIGVFTVLVLMLANTMLTSFELIDSYAKGELIYPNAALHLHPSHLLIPSPDRSPITRILLFIKDNPLYFAQLSSIKFFLFFGNVKPYFSVLHNLFIITMLYPNYFFAWKSFQKIHHFKNEKILIVTFIFTQAIIISLTSENWDGRFLVPVLPFIFILSSGCVKKWETIELKPSNGSIQV
jgi:hypothetical protein